jgi:hypothetical protein
MPGFNSISYNYSIIHWNSYGLVGRRKSLGQPALLVQAPSPILCQTPLFNELLPQRVARYPDFRLAGTRASSGELTHFRTEPSSARRGSSVTLVERILATILSGEAQAVVGPNRTAPLVVTQAAARVAQHFGHRELPPGLTAVAAKILLEQ